MRVFHFSSLEETALQRVLNREARHTLLPLLGRLPIHWVFDMGPDKSAKRAR